MVLGYVGYVPPTDGSILTGQIATFLYFALFVLLPLTARKEERWLIKRGLPPEVEAMMAGETREKGKLPYRRRKGDIS